MVTKVLKFPLKSHRKKIFIPGDSVLLAEFMGIVFGDGGINNDWQLVISLNSELDFEYSKYVAKLIKDLFNLEVSTRKRPGQNTLVIVCSSMNLLEFLFKKGAVKGNKIQQQFDTPKWIKENINYGRAFVRGLVDTDGCLYTHRHTVSGKVYTNIGFCFSSFSKPLLADVETILESTGIKPHTRRQKNSIYLYSNKAVIEYLQTFGSSNPRILNKYKKWRGARVVE
ncbi:MAG: LAGLIDADG family homing endonuclease [Candidatus Curtissbacteria bacterium]|nr:LAGLIDADG family homing endonuclease [Candidatus Curtissbacteria bacterium]